MFKSLLVVTGIMAASLSFAAGTLTIANNTGSTITPMCNGIKGLPITTTPFSAGWDLLTGPFVFNSHDLNCDFLINGKAINSKSIEIKVAPDNSTATVQGDITHLPISSPYSAKISGNSTGNLSVTVNG